jgi:hypothetical protein
MKPPIHRGRAYGAFIPVNCPRNSTPLHAFQRHGSRFRLHLQRNRGMDVDAEAESKCRTGYEERSEPILSDQQMSLL